MTRLLCRIGWHRWGFVLITTDRGSVWAAKHCWRCHWQTVGVPMGKRGAWGSPC